ncbi:MAG TPA: Tim44-like domain-containing protein [Burkholderiales bacterium]|nr:Tim44-like domain-containing protein [Burkholderiales bacterium]
MKLWKTLLAAVVLTLGMLMAVQSAEAARIGGGRSVGAQRSITQSQRTAPAAPQAAPAQTAPQPQVQQAPNRWLAPLAGLAAGLGLGWLFAHSGASFGPLLMLMAVLFIGYMLLRMLSRPRQPSGHAGYTGAYDRRPANYAGLGNETVAAPPPSQLPGSDWGGHAQALPAAPAIPPGFDAAGFLKQAKLNFIHLQEANDRGDLDALRDVTTDALFDSLAADLRARGGMTQHTDVVTLDATLLEVTTENNAHWASVKFAGQIREQAGAVPTPFAEVWHLTKPVDGGSGWLIAGIEQIS